MISIKTGRVLEVLLDDGKAAELRVEVDGEGFAAVAYTQLTGGVKAGDRVLLNTTAVELGLGSGGMHFVIANLDGVEGGGVSPEDGHIVKMNYTPMQCRVLSVEEPASPYHEAMRDFESLAGTPVLVGSLHSMAGPVCAALRLLCGERARVAYVMSDSACLPMAYSRTVRALREKGLVAGTVTYGNAFGGDVEAVNKFTALAAAKAALGANVIVAAMGVGCVGTGTRFGHGAMEQGEILNAASALGGTAIAIPRMSFADARPRHRGLSHHFIEALSTAALAPAIVPIPVLPPEKAEFVRGQLDESGISRLHRVAEFPGESAIEGMERFGLDVRTMGRGPGEDREFFLACGAAAAGAAETIITNSKRMSNIE